MSTLQAYLGVAGLTDVGYRFYTLNTPVAARQTSGIIDTGAGWYAVSGVTLAGDSVRWDSTGTAAAVAREDLAVRLAIAGISVGGGGDATLANQIAMLALLNGADVILLANAYVAPPPDLPVILVPVQLNGATTTLRDTCTDQFGFPIR